MSTSLKRITAQASSLRTLTAPDDAPVTSRVAEIDELGRTMAVAQRSIWSFARLVPKDIVKGINDGSRSTELGGARQEITILFTDVTNFTGIAEAANPDSLMHQTSRHFATLTQAFHAEGGTVDKFIGDSVMVFGTLPICSPTMSRGPVAPPFQPRRQARRSMLSSRRRDCRLSPLASDHLKTFYCIRHLGTHWS